MTQVVAVISVWRGALHIISWMLLGAMSDRSQGTRCSSGDCSVGANYLRECSVGQKTNNLWGVFCENYTWYVTMIFLQQSFFKDISSKSGSSASVTAKASSRPDGSFHC